MDVHKDLESIKLVATEYAKKHNCRYIIIIHNPVDDKFDPIRSTYEYVADSWFDKERSNYKIVCDTDELIMEESNGEWIKYREGAYQKEECDIKLHDGSVILHLYPNAGKFNKMCGNQEKTYTEEEVAEVRYPEYYLKDLCKGNCNNDRDEIPNIGPDLSPHYIQTFDDMNDMMGKYGIFPSVHVPQYIRESPKIQRNEPCPCGSGKKYKKCCMK